MRCLPEAEIPPSPLAGHPAPQAPNDEMRPDSLWPDRGRVEHEVAEIFANPLSPELARWAERYGQVGHRNSYLWNWCRHAVAITTLPCVPTTIHEEVCETKTLGVMLDVLMDDLADRCGNEALLEELLLLPLARGKVDFSRLSEGDRQYAALACEIWEEIMARAAEYPRYEEFAALLRFDYLQLCNSMRYSYLLNRDLHLLNLVEHDLYTPNNMHMMVSATLDLMCSPTFDHAELGKLRELVHSAQWMGRIGNLITTWQRELNEGDFTSGVYARAVSCGDLSTSALRRGEARVADVIQREGHEEYFLCRWRAHRQQLLNMRHAFRSFDSGEFVENLERLFCLHVGSRGRK